MSTRAFATLVVLAVLAGSPAATPATARAADGSFELHRLDNGLTILLSPSPAHPVVALSCFVTTGGRTEDEYYQGSLHYIEHLVFKGGTPNFAPTEYRNRMSLLGREYGWTWDDEIHFGFEVPKENFREALGVFREAMLELEFTEDWFEDEKRVVIQEMTRGREQPDRLLGEAWEQTAYQVHPYRRSVIGTEKAINELEMNATYEYYRERFTPNHMILSVSGDFSVPEMLHWLDEEWGELEAGPESFELGLPEPDQTGRRERVEHLSQASNAMTMIGFVGPGGRHEDVPALEMLAALIDDTSYGLPQYLIEQEKWVTSVSANCYVKSDASDFTIEARCEPEKAAAVSEFIEAFLVDFDATLVPDDVFEQVRRRLLFSEASRRTTNAERAERLGVLLNRRGEEITRTLVDRWSALSVEEVQAAKDRWVGSRRIVSAHVLPEGWRPVEPSWVRVQPGAPFAPPPPDLAVAGALEPAEGAPLPFEKTDEGDGVTVYTYGNGLQLLVRRVASSPVVAASGRVLGGQWVEPEGQDGINVFVSELGMRRTRRWDREGFQRLLASRSIEGDAHVSVGSRANTSRHVDYRDAGAHHYFGPTDEWTTMLACLKESLFFPEFDDAEIEKLRDDLVTRARQLRENNLEYIKQEFYRNVYAGHPYGRATFGDESSLASITGDELRAFHADHWRPERTVISVAGDVDPDEMAAWIASRWADLPAAPAEPWRIDPAEHAMDWAPPAETLVLDLGKNYWTVNWGRPGMPMTDPSFLHSVVLGRIAGNEHFYKYVYEEGVSYRSWIAFWQHLGPGAWILENDVNRERFDEILTEFDEDLARYSTAGFDQAEFDDALLRVVNRRVLRSQDARILAWRLAVAEGNGVGFRRETEIADAVRNVSYEDVQALAREVFAPDAILRLIQQ